jgi:hypothetical protein
LSWQGQPIGYAQSTNPQTWSRHEKNSLYGFQYVLKILTYAFLSHLHFTFKFCNTQARRKLLQLTFEEDILKCSVYLRWKIIALCSQRKGWQYITKFVLCFGRQCLGYVFCCLHSILILNMHVFI